MITICHVSSWGEQIWRTLSCSLWHSYLWSDFWCLVLILCKNNEVFILKNDDSFLPEFCLFQRQIWLHLGKSWRRDKFKNGKGMCIIWALWFKSDSVFCQTLILLNNLEHHKKSSWNIVIEVALDTYPMLCSL